jgi:thioredoxin reductase (NADPH)
VFYGAAVTDAKAMARQRVAVIGGANSARLRSTWPATKHVILLVRGDALAEGMSSYLLQELERAGNITVRLHTEVTEVHGAGRLETLTIKDGATKSAEILPAGALFILIGADPTPTGWPPPSSGTTAVSCSPAATSSATAGHPKTGRWAGPRCWRPACLACSPLAMSATAR